MHTEWKTGLHTILRSENLKGKDHLEDPGYEISNQR